MIVDSSALVAILRREPDAAQLSAALDEADQRSISAPTFLESSIVVTPRMHESLDLLLDGAEISVVPFDQDLARAARAAYGRFGKGSGSPARLNFGDCISYALATVSGEPLLFKGDDFRHTDVTSAL